jgi:quinol monooxygenase YgiN
MEQVLPFNPGSMPTSKLGNLTTCAIAMRFEAAQVVQAIRVLRSAIEPIRVKHGCRSCHIARDGDEEGVLRYTEEWSSEEAFRQHVQSAEFWPILIAMDLCSTEPQVRIGNLAVRGGLDLLLQLRGVPPLDSEKTTETPEPEPREHEGWA